MISKNRKILYKIIYLERKASYISTLTWDHLKQNITLALKERKIFSPKLLTKKKVQIMK